MHYEQVELPNFEAQGATQVYIVVHMRKQKNKGKESFPSQ